MVTAPFACLIPHDHVTGIDYVVGSDVLKRCSNMPPNRGSPTAPLREGIFATWRGSRTIVRCRSLPSGSPAHPVNTLKGIGGEPSQVNSSPIESRLIFRGGDDGGMDQSLSRRRTCGSYGTDSGRRLVAWVLAVGFETVPTAGAWWYSMPEEQTWFGQTAL